MGGPLSSARLAGSPPAAESVPAHTVLSFIPCDATASGAETAQVQLDRGAVVLSLCGHHFAVYELILLSAGWRITSDTRSQLS